MTELSKLKLRCRRGIRELDIVLNKYLDEHFEILDEHEKNDFNAAFKELLKLEDVTLYSMLLGNVEPLTPEQERVLHQLRQLYLG